MMTMKKNLLARVAAPVNANPIKAQAPSDPPPTRLRNPMIRLVFGHGPLRRRSAITKTLLAILSACNMTLSASAQNDVYAVEFGQSDNRFGTMNLLTGRFSQIASLGGAMINDIAYSPVNGTLYGINNATDLVTFDETNGTMTVVATMSVSGIQSIAFRPGDGALFGATQSALYTIDPVTGQATLVGAFGGAYNLGSSGQNIRFAQDGNLYVSNTSANTDIYRVSQTDGSAVWVGEVNGFPNLILENGGQYLYGVSIAVGAPGGTQPELLSFDLSSFVDGGTNADGSVHQITFTMVGAGPHFPDNFNFSGTVPSQAPTFTPFSAVSLSPIQPDGSLQVAVSGIVGQTYVIQASTNLVQWTAYSTNVTDSTGLITVVVPNAKSSPRCFFRSTAPQP